MPLYYLGNHRTGEQLDEMERCEAAGICIFCPDHLAAHPERQIILRTACWSVLSNQYPYAGTALHLLLVPDAHVSDMIDLDDAARADFWTVLDGVRAAFDLTHYGLGIRNGDPRYTGGTIYHLHVHVLVGDIGVDEFQPVRMKLSSRPGQ